MPDSVVRVKWLQDKGSVVSLNVALYNDVYSSSVTFLGSLIEIHERRRSKEKRIIRTASIEEVES
jgi:hypothetical protein